MLHLWLEVELHHCFSQRVSKAPQARYQAQHGTIESSIDLQQWLVARVIHIHHRHMAEEPAACVRWEKDFMWMCYRCQCSAVVQGLHWPRGHGLSSWVRWRVTGPHELDPLQFYPTVVGWLVEATMFHNLPHERDDSLSTCMNREQHITTNTGKHVFPTLYHTHYDGRI